MNNNIVLALDFCETRKNEKMSNDEACPVDTREPLPHEPRNGPRTEMTSSDDDDSKTIDCNTPTEQPYSIAPFNPSSRSAQDHALRLFSLTSDDVLFDLGCGDGRLLLTAASQIEGLRCVGIELDPIFVQRGRAALAKLPHDVQQRVQIRHGNVLLYDNNEPLCEKEDEQVLSACSHLTIREDSTAIYLYLLPKGLARLKADFLDSLVDQRIEQCGTKRRKIRIVSYMFRIHGWDPVAIDDGLHGGVRHYLYEFGSDAPSD